MPKAKRYKGVRLTRSPQTLSRPRKKGDGRPKGTLRKFKFEETRLGFMLKYEVPTIYELIMKMSPKGQFPEPRVLTIESICKASGDSSFCKPKFFRYLEEYKRKGIYCGRAQSLTPKRAKYYELIRERKFNEFVENNYSQIEKERKKMRAK